MDGTLDAGRPPADGAEVRRPDPRSIPPPLGRDPNRGLVISLLYVLYDFVWTAFVLATSPVWLTRCVLSADYRRMVRGRLTLSLHPLPPPESGRKRILVHGVSVGEVKASKSIVERLTEDYDVVISTSTNTGDEVAREVFSGHRVVRFPIDHLFTVWRFLNRVRPDCVVLMELEIWPNFLRRCNRLGIPVAIVSGRITEGSLVNYRRFGTTLPQFNRVTLLAAQEERYAARFAELAGSDERVVVTGNMKADGLRIGPVPRDEPMRELERTVGLRAGQLVLVAGSTHSPEERELVRAFREAAPDARIVLVPRHPNRASEVVRDLEEIGERPQLLTELRSGRGGKLDPDRPLVVDTIGELERVYALADVVFVGGSLIAHGGQNMLEPAAQGLPVLYGPHVENFVQEALLLEGAGAAIRVRDTAEVIEVVRRLAADPRERGRMAAAAVDAVERQKGATELTFAALQERCALA